MPISSASDCGPRWGIRLALKNHSVGAQWPAVPASRSAKKRGHISLAAACGGQDQL